MPFYLKDRDISSEVGDAHTVLIVPCRFCPAASLAVREGKPYIELFHRLFKTPAFEAYIQALKSSLAAKGVRTEVYDTKSPTEFVVCMWDAKRRKDLAKHASGYDALVVLGCGAAVETARYSLNSSDCQIIPGMEAEGIMNVIPALHFPFRVTLDVVSITRILQQETVTSIEDS